MITLSSKSGTTAKINPIGAELVSLRQNDREYIWEGDPKFWGKHSPVLFPIVGTLKENQYVFEGRSYRLPRHGFAREKEFALIGQSINCATFSLLWDDKTFDVYPFEFELKLIYLAENEELTIAYEITNHGDQAMPFSIGAHPAFALPGNFSDYRLRFENEAPSSYQLLKDDLVTAHLKNLEYENNLVTLTHSLFENDALIFKNIRSKSVTIFRANKPYVAVDYPEFPHLGIWTKPGAPFLCIEPWTGFSDTASTTGKLVEKESISLLPPRETFKRTFRIRIF